MMYSAYKLNKEAGIKTIPMEKKCKKAKWLSGEALQIAVKRREAKSKGEKVTRWQWKPGGKHGDPATTVIRLFKKQTKDTC